MIGEPSERAPTVAAIAAVPMLIITEVRTPASSTGSASGSSAWARRCRGLSPSAGGGLEHRRRHRLQAGEGAAQDRQQAIQRQRDQRRQCAKADQRHGHRQHRHRRHGLAGRHHGFDQRPELGTGRPRDEATRGHAQHEGQAHWRRPPAPHAHRAARGTNPAGTSAAAGRERRRRTRARAAACRRPARAGRARPRAADRAPTRPSTPCRRAAAQRSPDDPARIVPQDGRCAVAAGVHRGVAAGRRSGSRPAAAPARRPPAGARRGGSGKPPARRAGSVRVAVPYRRPARPERRISATVRRPSRRWPSVARPRKSLTQSAGRLRQQLQRRARLHDAPVVQQHQALAQAQRFVDVVRDQHDGASPSARWMRASSCCSVLPGQRIERAEGLVHQQQRGPRRQRPCHAHALLLAARQLVRIALAVGPPDRGRAASAVRRLGRQSARPASPAAPARWRCCAPLSSAGTGRSTG